MLRVGCTCTLQGVVGGPGEPRPASAARVVDDEMPFHGDVVGSWEVTLSDGVHTVEFEHGTTTGKRVIRVDGKVKGQRSTPAQGPRQGPGGAGDQGRCRIDNVVFPGDSPSRLDVQAGRAGSVPPRQDQRSMCHQGEDEA